MSNHTIKTATGKEYNITAAAVGSIDGAFRVWIVGGVVSDLISVFANPEETVTLIESFDGVEKTFSGYTVFLGIAIAQETMITLARGD